MVNYTYANLKSDLTGLGAGADLAQIQNLNQLVERAGRTVISKIDPTATKRKHLLTLYDGVYDYAVPSDDDFKKAFDLRPQTNRSLLDNFTGKFSEEFDKKKQLAESLISTEWQDGTQFFRIKRNVNSKTATLDGLDAVGNWAVHGDGDNLTADSVTHVKGGASLNFDLDGSTTSGGITNASLTSIDLSEHDELGSFFLWIYFPDSSAITNVDLRWGNSATVYWNRTVTAPHFGSFVNGWNLLRFDWNGATETGTVDPSAIDYVRINITYDGTADTDFRVDSLTCKLGVIYELLYYSKFLFRSSSGTWKSTVSADADIVNLDVDNRNILVFECLDEMGKQLVDDDLRNIAREELFGIPDRKEGLYDLYKRLNPSEAIKKIGNYYKVV